MIARVGGNELSISTSRSPHFILDKIKAENVQLQSSTLGITCRYSIFNLSTSPLITSMMSDCYNKFSVKYVFSFVNEPQRRASPKLPTLRGCLHDTGMTFILQRVHSIPIYFSTSVNMIPSQNFISSQVTLE